jgi:hypothetical protein
MKRGERTFEVRLSTQCKTVERRGQPTYGSVKPGRLSVSWLDFSKRALEVIDGEVATALSYAPMLHGDVARGRCKAVVFHLHASDLDPKTERSILRQAGLK